MRKLLLILTLLLSASLVPTAAQAAACTEITLPAAISVPGSYCLGASASASISAGSLLNINSSDVQLDCRGMTIHNTQTSANANTYGIYTSGHSNISIRNCRITGGWAAGIYAYQNNGLANTNGNLHITGNDINGAFWFGILAYGGDVEVTGNRVTDIGGRGSFAMGIRVGGSTLSGERRTHVVRGNVVANVRSPVNNAYGIYSNNSDDGAFVDNNVTGTKAASSWYAYAIRVASGSRNRIADNHVAGVKDDVFGVGIMGMAQDACYHNYVRAEFLTLDCDAALGNY